MHLRLTFFFACLLFATPAWSDGPAPDAAAAQIRTLLARDISQAAPDNDLRRFYALRQDEPAWRDPAAVAALAAALAGAADQGLPASFALPPGTEIDDAARDIASSRVALAYAAALARGRVALGEIETDWAIPAPDFDVAAGLEHALSHGLGAWYAKLAPHHPAYVRLVAALKRYRALAPWAPIPRGGTLKPGMVDERVTALRQRLEAEGDLAPLPPATPPPAPVADQGPIQRIADMSGGAGVAAAAAPADPALAADPAAHFDGAVEKAVRRFQLRYGIAVDGTVGPRTLAAMNVPLKARIAQIALNLERWRALPHDLGTTYMLVNAPAARLDVIENGIPVIGMKVVVGDVDHPTPVVRTTMLALTINPTWTIPSSIVTEEILPKAKKSPSYLERNDIVFTPGRGWQQRPGPRNPLGQLKFETPNQFDVYLHDTPSRLAFDRYFRAQSHGCVRLEDAAELAGFVLAGQGWNELQLSEEIASGSNRRIALTHRWRVWLLYATSFADEDGTVEFRDDLYGRDARLRDALAEQPVG